MSETETLIGKEVHMISGTKYNGCRLVTEVEEIPGNEWFWWNAGKIRGSVRMADCFETEEEARAAAKARRKPRQKREVVHAYGDLGWVAAFNGVKG